ncbi:MAG TPA: hypothetical protein VMW65_11275 [Chloroflexota bacterium]|nr:hypothetical protein [Chloroflexota bacterium]
MVSTLLLSPLHDPEARLLRWAERLSANDDPLSRAWHSVKANYGKVLAVASPVTDSRTRAVLERAGWVIANGSNGIDRGLWAMVQRGLDDPVERIHFCDLDRVIHWLCHYPDELRQLPEVWDKADLVMLARSPRAFASHPPCQTLTEGLANQVIASRIGVRFADAFSGSYIWNRRAAEAVLRAPGPRDLRFYSEGVVGPFRAGCSVLRHEVEGLEWETPDQFVDEIGRFGFDTWLQQFESSQQWRSRAEMASLFVEAALS